MQHARTLQHLDSRRRTALHIAGRDADRPARPAWWILVWTVGIAMALWATGILELPSAERRLVDWIGGVTVLAVLVVWVRVNAGLLATADDQHDRDDRLRVRLIRSRRPPLDAVGGPDIQPLRRGTDRIPPS